MLRLVLIVFFSCCAHFEGLAQIEINADSIRKNVELIYREDKIQNDSYSSYSDSIIEHLNQEYLNFLNRKNYPKAAEVLGQIGEQEINIGNPHSAIKHFYEMLEISKEIKNDRLIAKAYNYIGIVQSIYQNYKDAIRSYKDAIKIYETLDEKKSLSGAINNIGIVYKHLGQYDIALEYFKDFLEMNKKVQNNKGIAVGYCNIAEIYYLKLEFSMSLEYFNKSLYYDSIIDNEFSKSNTLNKIASVLLQQNNINEAELVSKKALNLALKYSNINEISNSCFNLYQIFENKKNYKTALEMYKLHSSINDSITNLEGQTEVLREKFKFEYEQKQNLENIKMLERESSQKLSYQRNIFILILIFCLVILIAFIKYRNNSLERKRLLAEIKILKSEYAVKNAMRNAIINELTLDQAIIDELTENKLNETDWKILETLYDTPAISNKELSDKIFLSYEGTRSSLKKMYRLFEINTSKNQRFELISKVIKLSTEKNSNI